MKLFDLTGQVAVVTGAGSGLGREIAVALGEAGANLVCADIDEVGNEATAVIVRELGREALSLRCDVGQETQVDALFDEAERRFGRVDIAVANAGITEARPSRLHEYDAADWRRVMSINLDGVFYTDRAALKIMARQRRGKLINIASMWGLAGAASVRTLPAYSASKGAVVNLTRELALEYATMNIQVNAICPGFFRTALSRGHENDPAFIAATNGFTPMGRMAEAAEIKGAALYLASAASSFTTGTMLVVDGGCMAK